MINSSYSQNPWRQCMQYAISDKDKESFKAETGIDLGAQHDEWFNGFAADIRLLYRYFLITPGAVLISNLVFIAGAVIVYRQFHSILYALVFFAVSCIISFGAVGMIASAAAVALSRAGLSRIFDSIISFVSSLFHDLKRTAVGDLSFVEFYRSSIFRIFIPLAGLVLAKKPFSFISKSIIENRLKRSIIRIAKIAEKAGINVPKEYKDSKTVLSERGVGSRRKVYLTEKALYLGAALIGAAGIVFLAAGVVLLSLLIVFFKHRTLKTGGFF